MDQYIHVRSPYSDAEISAFIQAVLDYSDSHCDGRILSGILQFAYHCALKKGELLGLRIRDVCSHDGEIVQELKIKEEVIKLSVEARAILEEHITYLKAQQRYMTDRRSFLFPDIGKKKIGVKKYKPIHNRQFSRDIKNICKENGIRQIQLEKIRQAGICKYYESLKAQGLKTQGCLDNAMKFARCTEKHLIDILQKRITPSGNRRDIDLAVFKKFDAKLNK